MKYSILATGILTIVLLVLSVTPSFAWVKPLNTDKKYGCYKHKTNVATYYTGIHTIAGEQNDIHTGCDTVYIIGKQTSGKVQQNFFGKVKEVIGQKVRKITEAEYSKWIPSKSPTDCEQKGMIRIHDANDPAHPEDSWGSYLIPYTDYCVRNTEILVHPKISVKKKSL